MSLAQTTIHNKKNKGNQTILGGRRTSSGILLNFSSKHRFSARCLFISLWISGSKPFIVISFISCARSRAHASRRAWKNMSIFTLRGIQDTPLRAAFLLLCATADVKRNILHLLRRHGHLFAGKQSSSLALQLPPVLLVQLSRFGPKPPLQVAHFLGKPFIPQCHALLLILKLTKQLLLLSASMFILFLQKLLNGEAVLASAKSKLS